MQLSRKKTIIEERAIIVRRAIIEERAITRRVTIIEEKKTHLSTIQSIH
jgi:hypothetical protein